MIICVVNFYSSFMQIFDKRLIYLYLLIRKKIFITRKIIKIANLLPCVNVSKFLWRYAICAISCKLHINNYLPCSIRCLSWVFLFSSILLAVSLQDTHVRDTNTKIDDVLAAFPTRILSFGYGTVKIVFKHRAIFVFALRTYVSASKDC